MPERLASELERNLPPDVHGRLLLAGDADQALEYGEDRVLEAHESTAGADRTGGGVSLLELVADDLEAHLDRQIVFERLVEELEAWLKPRDYEPGDTIASAGEALGGLQLVISGPRLGPGPLRYAPGSVQPGRRDRTPGASGQAVRGVRDQGGRRLPHRDAERRRCALAGAEPNGAYGEVVPPSRPARAFLAGSRRREVKLLQSLAPRRNGHAAAGRISSALILGLIAGSNVVVTVVPLGSVVFSGALAPYSIPGTRLVLLGNAIVCLFIALGSGYRGAVGMSPPATLVVLAGIAATLPLSSDTLFATMIATIGLAALATGLCTMLLGSFKLANLMRFVPFPLACGFVAGIGGLCFRIAFSLMGVTPALASPGSLLQPFTALNWSIGITYGLGLFLVTRRRKRPLILPVSFVLTIAAFYLTLSLLGVPLAEAEAHGLLLAGVSGSADSGLRLLFDPRGSRPGGLGRRRDADPRPAGPGADDRALPGDLSRGVRAGRQAGPGLEPRIQGGRPGLDGRRRLRSSAGMPQRAPLPAQPHLRGGYAARRHHHRPLHRDRLRLRQRGAPARAHAALVGGMLLFTGATLLDSWLVQVRRQLPGPEFAIVVLIFLTILFFGFLVGVGVGAAVLVMFLLTRLASVDPVESRFSARERRSSRGRSVPDQGHPADAR